MARLTPQVRFNRRELRAAGRDWVRDFGKAFDDPENEGQSAAYEIAACYVTQSAVGAAAEEVYEGMLKELAKVSRVGRGTERECQARPNVARLM